ncbi:MAG: STAS domain-containing protein [Cytophagales bacterium]|nr:STAS domain-containing protein [Cytophagales bacterium]
MKFTEKTENNILQLTFHGDLLGIGDTLELMDLINEKINAGVLKSIINMKDVRYMNSSGIGILITIYTKFKNRNGEAVIINAAEQITKLLNMTKLNTVIKIFGSEQDALTKLNW